MIKSKKLAEFIRDTLATTGVPSLKKTAAITEPPTKAELVTNYGAVTKYPTGRVTNLGLLFNSGGTSKVYQVTCDGVEYYYVEVTVAA